MNKKTEYTKEQKNEFFQNLRNQWKESKKLAENDEDAKKLYQALLRETGGDFSFWSFHFIYEQMLKQNLSGVPYVNCKTFELWKQSGYKVKKGEKSKIKGITWVGPDPEEAQRLEDEGKKVFAFPKVYYLFHESQVEPLEIH